MKQPIITAGVLSLGLAMAATTALASEMEERFREEGKQLDLTGFLQAETDARSRSFFYGRAHEHDFTVKEAGTYLFESGVPGGESRDYRIEAVLRDSEGQVIARGEGLGQAGGLALRQRLAPGDYVLQVEGRKFGTRSRQGNSFYITVSGLDVEEGVSSGEGFVFTGRTREGGRSAFVRRADEAVALAPSAAAAGQAASDKAAEPVAQASTDNTPQRGTSPDPAAPEGFEELVTDVKIRARGEVLTFDMVEAGRVAITTSTFPSGEEDTYRIELEVLDEQGRVVAEDAGEGFDGDIDLETELAAGRYRLRVQGQKFGSAHSGVNNYELKVRRLD